MEPTFLHYPASSLPERSVDGCTVRVILGSALRPASPVLTLFADAVSRSDAAGRARWFTCSTRRTERAVYVVSGRVAIGADAYGEGTLAVLRAGTTAPLTRAGRARHGRRRRAVGPRHIWWNFVSSSEARIERAKHDWARMRMGTVPGDDEFIPLPNT